MRGVVGLDLSLSSTGFARIDGSGQFEVMAIRVPPSDSVHRIMRIVEIMWKIVNMVDRKDVVFIEDYAYRVGGKTSSLASLGELNGIVKLAVFRKTSNPPIEVPIGTWKKFLSNNGALKKDEFKLKVFQKFGIECKTNDEAAAVAIADLGWHAIGNPPLRGELLKYEADSIKALIKRNPFIKNLQALAKRR